MSIKQILPIAMGVFAIIVVLLVRMWKKRVREQEEQKHAVRRMREEALDRALANPMGEDSAEYFEKKRRPFKVEYSKDENHAGGEYGDERMFQLTEITELSRRKYIFRCSERVQIGTQFGNVTILPNDADEGLADCQIFFYQQENYLRSTGKIEVVLTRRGKQVIVNQNGLKLRSGDQFVVGKTTYLVEFNASR